VGASGALSTLQTTLTVALTTASRFTPNEIGLSQA